ncbi:MAG: DUF2157 domain-containing protein [Myxococcales bacterium]|nr:DUF2157 domain-containing protein [Myxococcales bacterium]
MAKRQDAYFRSLEKDARRWVAKGLIEEEQRVKILSESRAFAEGVDTPPQVEPASRQAATPPRKAAKTAQAGAPERDVVGWLPTVMVGIATLLVGVGILLFYAANWRFMSTTLKLSQIFVLLTGLYGAAFYGLAVRGSQLFGRSFLFLGLVAFGAAIGLIAQIFHISAHPSNGVLLWAIVAASMSWLLRDVASAYLSAALLLVWNLWEVSVYLQPNVWFALAIVGLVALFVRCASRLGLVFTAAFSLVLFFQLNFHALWRIRDNAGYSLDMALFAGALACLPLGLLCLALGRFLERWPLAAWAKVFFGSVGLLLLWGPLIGVSWPLNFSVLYPHLTGFAAFLIFQYIAFLAIAQLLSSYTEQSTGKKASPLFSWMSLAAIALFVLPLGDKRVLLIATHLGLLLTVFMGLGDSFLSLSVSRVERSVAWMLAIATLFIKMFAFIGLGIESRYYYVAYVLGFVMFGVVFFLCNLLVEHVLRQQKRSFPVSYLQGLGVLLSYATFYILSFKLVDTQTNIFQASYFVVVLLVFFVVLASALFLYLIFQSAQKLPVALCGAIFLATCIGLFASGPRWSWVAYSLYFNIILFLMVALLLFYSVKINSVRLVYFALGGLILQVITRYFDVLWELISGSLLFIVTGLLVMVGGYLLNRQRRLLLEVIEASRQQGQAGRGGVQ